MDDAKSSPIVSDAKSNSVDMIARLEAHRDRGGEEMRFKLNVVTLYSRLRVLWCTCLDHIFFLQVQLEFQPSTTVRK